MVLETIWFNVYGGFRKTELDELFRFATGKAEQHAKLIREYRAATGKLMQMEYTIDNSKVTFALAITD